LEEVDHFCDNDHLTDPSSCDEEELGLVDQDYEEMPDTYEDESRGFVPKIDHVLLSKNVDGYPTYYLVYRVL